MAGYQPSTTYYDQLSRAAATQVYESLMAATSMQEARHHATALLDQHPRLSLGLTPTRILWRAVKADDPGGFDRLDRVLAPPPDKAGTGRLNDRGSPRLYVAYAVDTAIAELTPKPGEFFHVIGLLCPQDSAIRVTVVGEHHHVVRTGYMKNVGYDPDRTITRELHRQGRRRMENIAYADSLLADVLADERARDKGYTPSRGLGDVLRHKEPDSHGIQYPSVRHPLGTNLCLEVDSSTAPLKPVASMTLRVDQTWRNGYLDLSLQRRFVLGKDGVSFERHAARGDDMVLFNITPEEHARVVQV